MKESKPIDNVAKQIQALPQELTPQRDLWPGIEKAIAMTSQDSPQKEVKRLVPIAWAASIVLAVFVAWGTFTPMQQQAQMSVELVNLMERDFNQQKSVMLASFGQPKLSALPSEMQAQLTSLATARKSIIKALQEQPNNSDLLNLLRFTQQQELNLLEKLYSPQWQTI